MPTIWISPTDIIGGPSTVISYPFASHPTAQVTTTGPGTRRILIALRLPENVHIDEAILWYRVGNPQSFISRMQLLEIGAPGSATAIHDDSTPLQSTAPVRYTSPAGGVIPTPGAAVTMALEMTFLPNVHRILVGGVGVKYTAIDVCENRHLLSEFGPYATVADAHTTLQHALAALIADGGGVLCIPRDAPQGFHARNLEQSGQDAPAVTVVDYRNGVGSVFVPPMGAPASEGEGRGCRTVERDLARNLGWQDVVSTEYIQSRFLGGASSYLQQLTQAVQVPNEGSLNLDQKLHVPSHRGLFIGQTLLATGGTSEVVIVKDLGIDSGGCYFVADLLHSHPAGGWVYNKNVVNGLTVEDTSNCDNQSPSLNVERRTYGTGDTFGISVRLGYQGDILSGGGDEGGLGIASQIEHDVNGFVGQVESWNPLLRELVYAPLVGAPHKLGTSRPLVNLNPAKWITAGKVMVVRQGSSFMPPMSPPPG